MEDVLFLWKRHFPANYKPDQFTELKASTFGHMHFPLETQQQSTQHERQTNV